MVARSSDLAIAIEHEIGGYEHDWRLPAVQQRLTELVTAQSVIAVIYMLNCNPWSALHCIQHGPPVLFDADNLSGIHDSSGQLLHGRALLRLSRVSIL